jgi:hypothetical protein
VLVKLTERADRTVSTLVKHRPDALVARTGRAKYDRTRWSRNGPDALVKLEPRSNETATEHATELTGRHSASVRLESSKLPDRPDASGRL